MSFKAFPLSPRESLFVKMQIGSMWYLYSYIQGMQIHTPIGFATFHHGDGMTSHAKPLQRESKIQQLSNHNKKPIATYIHNNNVSLYVRQILPYLQLVIMAKSQLPWLATNYEHQTLICQLSTQEDTSTTGPRKESFAYHLFSIPGIQQPKL